MPHHREGIQNDLDKAYDEGHRDNKAFDESQMKSEGETHISDKEMQGKLSADEKAMVVEKEDGIISPELAETLARLKDKGYLDISFEGKEVHELSVRPLSKEEALAEYKKSGWVWDEIEKNMPYTTPEAGRLDVMTMNFNKNISSEDAVKEMDTLGVRPLTYEELIQYGIAHPSHQKQKRLVGLGSKNSLGGWDAPFLDVAIVVRMLNAVRWDRGWADEFSFLVVCK